jgi:hypothetical protein
MLQTRSSFHWDYIVERLDLIDCSATCRYLKKLACKGTLRVIHCRKTQFEGCGHWPVFQGDPEPQVFGPNGSEIIFTDLDPDLSINKQKIKKSLYFLQFLCDLNDLLSLGGGGGVA